MRSRIEQERLEYAYKVYVTDSLQAAGENKYLTARWVDIIKDDVNVDTRSADEIVLDIMTRAELKPKGGEEQ